MLIKKRLVGQRFGKLTVLRRWAGSNRGGNHDPIWECRCDCGAVTYPFGSNLTRGLTRSCGHARFSAEHRAKLSAAKIGNANARKKAFAMSAES